jgi:DNA-directed RNA polymerase specialized sigma subunit
MRRIKMSKLDQTLEELKELTSMQEMKLIQKIAWSFHKTTGLPIDDLIGEASLAYATWLPKYDPKKARLSTFMYIRIKCHLIDYCKKQNEYYLKSPEDAQTTIDSFSSSHENRIIFKSAIENGSEEIKYLVWMIFQSPSEFLGYGGRGKVKDKLRKEGWTWDQIWKTFTEMRKLLRSM